MTKNSLHKIEKENIRSDLIESELIAQIKSELYNRALNACLTHKTTVIQAPSGYGKQHLVQHLQSEISLHNEVTCINFSLNKESLNTKSFNEYLTLFCQSLAKNNIYISDYELKKLEKGSPEQIAIDIIQTLENKTEYVFIFSEIDNIKSNEWLKFIQAIIINAPTNCHFILSSHQILDISLSELALNNQVFYISQLDLKFSQDESLQYLYGHRNKGITTIEQECISLCSGWLKALQVLKIIKKQSTNTAHVINQLEQNVELEKFFEQHFLQLISHQQKQLLPLLSLLPKFTLPQFQQASNIDRSFLKTTFQMLSLFDIEFNDGYQWHCIHPLLLNYIQQNYQEEDKKKLHQFKLNAAHWLNNNGFTHDALTLVFEIQNYDLAAQWLTEHANYIKTKGMHQNLFNWLQQLPKEYIEKDIDLAKAYILCLLLSKKYLQSSSITHELSRIASQLSHHDEFQAMIQRLPPLLMIISQALEDQIEGLEEKIDGWLTYWLPQVKYKENPDYYLETALALLVKGFVSKSTSNFIAANNAFNKARKHFETYQSDYGIVWTDALHIISLAKQGLYIEALNKAEHAYQFCQRHLDINIDIKSMLSALLSTLYFDKHDIENSDKYSDNDWHVIHAYGYSDILIAAHRTEYAKRFYLDQKKTGTINNQFFNDLKLLIDNALAEQHDRFAYSMINDLILFFIESNQISEALEYAKLYQIDNTHSAFCYKARILLLIKQKQFESALNLINQRISHCLQLNRYKILAEYYQLKAICLASTSSDKNHDKEAIDALVECLEISSKRQYISIFYFQSQPLEPLFEKIINTQLIIDNKLKSFSKIIYKTIYQNSENEIQYEALTKKEIQVIKLAENGESTFEIAEQLHISQGTLKWHLHNIYQKLQVKNRMQAVNKAKDLNYI